MFRAELARISTKDIRETPIIEEKNYEESSLDHDDSKFQNLDISGNIFLGKEGYHD
jgi:hypothetical protein